MLKFSKSKSMKPIYLIFLLFIAGCIENQAEKNTGTIQGERTDSVSAVFADTAVEIIDSTLDAEHHEIISNGRFRNISITKTDTVFTITGQARVFEATIDWVIEDRQQVIKKGYVNAGKGAPEWGNFKLTIRLKKPSTNSSVKLILFETSANDGSRQYEVPLTLY
jgi:hypothetical protein